MSEVDEHIQDLLNWLIHSKNLTERELAQTAGVSQSYINKIKNGKISLKALKTVIRILAKYDVLVMLHQSPK